MKALFDIRPGTESRRQRREERGAYMVLMSFGVIAILALAALALNTAKLYLDKMQMQKASDAAVLAGLAFHIRNAQLKLTDADALKTGVEREARSVAFENLRAAYPSLTDQEVESQIFTHTVTYSQGKGQATTLQYQIRTTNLFSDLYLRVLNLIAGKVTVGVNAQAELQPANVALMLDVSGSMNCPATDNTGTCQCIRTSTCEDADSKLNILRNAAINFLNTFTDGYDRISVIPFNTGASMGNHMAQEFSFQTTKNLVANLKAGGNTNTSDAFMHAYLDARFKNLIGEQNTWWNTQEISYVYFSDGAPTAANLLFANPMSGELDVSNANPKLALFAPPLDDVKEPLTPPTIYRYQHYRVEWTLNGETWFGPSALMHFDTVPPLYNYGEGFPPGWDPPIPGKAPLDREDQPPPGIPTCTSQHYDNTMWSALTSCLNDFSFHLPGDATRVFGQNVPMDRWSEQYYNAPLALSDFLREHRGVVYAIGLGTAPKEDRNITHPGPSKLQPDPYQNAFRDFTRHDYFLARLALDPYAAETNPGGSRDTSFRYIFDAGNGGFHQPPYRTLFRQDSRVNYMIPNFTPTPDFHNNDDIATNLSLWADFFPPPEKCTLASGSGGAATIGSNVPPKNRPRACRDMRYRYGEYLPTNNAADLNALFERIARKILLRLMR